MAEKYDNLENKAFVAELDKCVADYESGKVKGISWEEVKKKAVDRLDTQAPAAVTTNG
jgi:putative addiction module component (TIGR02574 family)